MSSFQDYSHSTFADYAHKYETIQMKREEGILQLTLHSNGGPWLRTPAAARDCTDAFHDIASDPDTRVVIMTGTGDSYSGPRATAELMPFMEPGQWKTEQWQGARLITNLLSIEAPIISAINGPALRHAELPLLADIVLASEDAAFQDSGHIFRNMAPGDGMHIAMPLLMGINRARYFLLTGQVISAHQAQDFGLVNEVLPRDQLVPRAWEIARELVKKSPLVLRYTRIMLTQYLRVQMHNQVGFGLALEGLASIDWWASENPELAE